MGPSVGPIVISALVSACGGESAPVMDAAAAPIVADAAADQADDDAWPWAGKEETGPVDHAMPGAYPRPTYAHLGETGLYNDIASGAFAGNLTTFTPNHVLWSDGAEK